MATRSSIAILNINGTVEGHYCHSDGYLSWNGVKLYLHYQSVSKVKKLIELGDMSVLHPEVEPPKGYEHSYDNPFGDVSVFYGRDRGESGIDSKKYDSLESYLKTGDFQEYDYIFKEKNQQWYLINHKTQKLQKLSTLLLKDEEASKYVKAEIAAEKQAKKLNKELPINKKIEELHKV